MLFDGPLAPGSEFRWKAGPATIVSTLREVEPPGRISWLERTLFIRAVHGRRLEPRDGGTHVETEKRYSGFLARLLRGPLQKTLDAALEEGVQRLKLEAERRARASS
jgi:hypothetical protein